MRFTTAPDAGLLGLASLTVDDLEATLSPEDQARFCRSGRALLGSEKPRDFIRRIAPHEPPPRHLDPIIDVIEYARLKPIRVTFDMGPGHAKTTGLCRMLAWWLSDGQSPGDTCGYLSYSDEQARKKSLLVKDAHELGGGVLRPDSKAAGHWRTRAGGGLIARGARGGMMGNRIPGLMIYDDPYKDVKEARSEAINGAVIEQFKGMAFTRLQGGSVIVLHTRWHDDDLIGYIQRELKWDSISIPTICEDETTDILGRKVGEVAWPEKYPYEICTGVCGHDGHLEEIKRTLGDHLWAAMFQGRPRPQGRAVFHEPARYWLRGDPDHMAECQLNGTCKERDLHPFTWTGKRGVIAVDPAATATTQSDWSAIVVMAIEGLGVDSRAWIVEVVRVQCEIPDLVKEIRRVQLKYRLMVACEAIGGFKAVPQSLRALDPKLRVMDITTGGKDKYTRAQPVAGAWNDGRVLVPMDVEWAEPYVKELTRFSGAGGGEIDDQVDGTSHGWNVLYRAKPRKTADDYDEASV